MENTTHKPRLPWRSVWDRMRDDERGSVVVEAAFALPILITVLLGMISYGSWFITAHHVQSAANDAARAALSGLNNAERARLVANSIGHSVIGNDTLDPTKLEIETSIDGAYYTVTLRYDGEASLIDAASLLPMPSDQIERTAVVRLAGV